jgi:four helix bundle protein
MLRIVDVMLVLIADVAPLADALGRKDPDLERQLRRALNSALLNTREGSRQRGRRRGNHYAMAVGSAEESLGALQAAAAWGYLKPLPEGIVERFRHVIGTLVKVSR